MAIDPWVEAEAEADAWWPDAAAVEVAKPPGPPGPLAALRQHLAVRTNAVVVGVIVLAMLLVDALLRSVGR